MSYEDVIERLRTRRLRQEVKTADGTLMVRGLSGTERHEYYAWIRSTADEGASLMLSDHRIVALALCKENGEPMFDSIEEGLRAVGDFNSEDTQLLAKEVLRLSGMNRGSTDDAEKKS